MSQKTMFKALVIAAASASIGYLTYLENSLTKGMLTTFMAAWILFQFRSFEKTWASLGNFQNPFLFAINTVFATYIYIKLVQPGVDTLLVLSAAFILGGVISTLTAKYWNIGG